MRKRFRPGRSFLPLRSKVDEIEKVIAPKPLTSGDAREARQFKKKAATDPVGALLEREMQ